MNKWKMKIQTKKWTNKLKDRIKLPHLPQNFMMRKKLTKENL